VPASTGRATTAIMSVTTAHLVSRQAARKHMADPPAVPHDYAIKFHLVPAAPQSRQPIPSRDSTKPPHATKPSKIRDVNSSRQITALFVQSVHIRQNLDVRRVWPYLNSQEYLSCASSSYCLLRPSLPRVPRSRTLAPGVKSTVEPLRALYASAFHFNRAACAKPRKSGHF
jgi:hypothetical protein